MTETGNGFIKNLCYLFLMCIIALGLITIVGSNRGGGGGDADGGGGETPFWLRPVETDDLPTYVGIIIDFNSDDYQDFIGQAGDIETWEPALLRPFVNDGNGDFALASAQLVDSVSVIGLEHFGFAKADFNGDGLMDLYIADGGRDDEWNEGAQNKLTFQTESGGLVDVTATHLPAMSCWTHDCDVGDIDGDGDIDIFDKNVFSSYADSTDSVVYINDGQGNFTSGSEKERIPLDLLGLYPWNCSTCNLFDSDRDGDLDLLLIGCSSFTYYGEGEADFTVELKNFLLLNDGEGYFTETRDGTFPYPEEIMTDHKVKIADFDGDGWPDALVVGIEFCWEYLNPCEYQSYSIHLYMNNADGTFRDASNNLPPLELDWSVNHYNALHLGDFNGDGWMDYLVDMHGETEEIFMYINKGGGEAKFIRAENNVVNEWGSWRNCYPGDFDNDGDTDLFVLTSGTNVWIAENLKPYEPAAPLNTPAKIQLLLPSNGSTSSSTPILTWNHQERALTYSLQVCLDPNFEVFTLDKADLTGNSLYLSKLTSQPGFKELEKGVTYYWRVAGTNYSGQGEWSNTFSFETEN